MHGFFPSPAVLCESLSGASRLAGVASTTPNPVACVHAGVAGVEPNPQPAAPVPVYKRLRIRTKSAPSALNSRVAAPAVAKLPVLMETAPALGTPDCAGTMPPASPPSPAPTILDSDSETDRALTVDAASGTESPLLPRRLFCSPSPPGHRQHHKVHGLEGVASTTPSQRKPLRRAPTMSLAKVRKLIYKPANAQTSKPSPGSAAVAGLLACRSKKHVHPAVAKHALFSCVSRLQPCFSLGCARMLAISLGKSRRQCQLPIG